MSNFRADEYTSRRFGRLARVDGKVIRYDICVKMPCEIDHSEMLGYIGVGHKVKLAIEIDDQTEYRFYDESIGR